MNAVEVSAVGVGALKGRDLGLGSRYGSGVGLWGHLGAGPIVPKQARVARGVMVGGPSGSQRGYSSGVARISSRLVVYYVDVKLVIKIRMVFRAYLQGFYRLPDDCVFTVDEPSCRADVRYHPRERNRVLQFQLTLLMIVGLKGSSISVFAVCGGEG